MSTESPRSNNPRYIVEVIVRDYRTGEVVAQSDCGSDAGALSVEHAASVAAFLLSDRVTKHEDSVAMGGHADGSKG